MMGGKVVILAGGMGTRLAEETEVRPKPMVEIGGQPILWHILKIFSAFGLNEFVVCLGYKGYMIKEYFGNYYRHMADVTFDMSNNSAEFHDRRAEPWKITLVDTGLATMTGGRLKRIKQFLDSDFFCMTYGDGVADVNIHDLLSFHRSHGRLATITAVRPPARFGALEIENGSVTGFREKPPGDGSWINGGFFVLSPRVLDYVHGDETVWEREPLERLARERELMAYQHDGFWQPMDTLRDKRQLEDMWSGGHAPWRVW
jgi:glucose-1-phosphate cytidylyltransferase